MDDIALIKERYRQLFEITQLQKDVDLHIKLIDAASIIYQLFLDRNSLFDRVNRDINIKITFKYCPYKSQDLLKDGVGYTQIATIHQGKINGDRQEYNRKEFFKAAAYMHGEKIKSVGDIIKLYRNKMGGAHSVAAGKSSEKDISELVSINGVKQNGYDNRMYEVVKSVVEALTYFVSGLKNRL